MGDDNTRRNHVNRRSRRVSPSASTGVRRKIGNTVPAAVPACGAPGEVPPEAFPLLVGGLDEAGVRDDVAQWVLLRVEVDG